MANTSFDFFVEVILPSWNRHKEDCLSFLCTSSFGGRYAAKIYKTFLSNGECPKINELPKDEKDSLLTIYNEALSRTTAQHNNEMKIQTIKSIYITGFIAANI